MHLTPIRVYTMYVRVITHLPFFPERATESDLSKLLDSANEKTAINLLYSGYDGWVSSNGEKNKDWYKEIKKN